MFRCWSEHRIHRTYYTVLYFTLKTSVSPYQAFCPPTTPQTIPSVFLSPILPASLLWSRMPCSHPLVRSLGKAACPTRGSTVGHVGSWDKTGGTRAYFRVYLEDTRNEEDKERPHFLAKMKERQYGYLHSSTK